MYFRSAFLAALTLGTAFLTGCHDIPYMKEESAQRSAMPMFMIPRIVPADPFTLQAFERGHKKYTTGVLYIEGDGLPYAQPKIMNFNPSPADPVGLRIAAQDGSPNVMYLARPCHYRQGYQGKKDCPGVFTGEGRFSEAVIHGYMNALDNIKAYHDLTGFELVGYDGGAAIATILAARRTDVTSLRTIAGNLDTTTTSYINKTEPLAKSLNPVNYAPQLANMPQRHFIGKLDKITPPEVYSAYAQALGPSSCISVSLIDNADHEHGWVEQWNTLRNLPVACSAPVALEPAPEPAPVPFDPATLDGPDGLGPK